MTASNAGKDQENGREIKAEGGPFYHVNTDRKGQIQPHGEELTGSEILRRAELTTTERYELFPVEGGRLGAAIAPEATRHVKPGDHFRATLRGADYSAPRSR